MGGAEDKMLSVIVVCFNECGRIGLTLDSILEQRYDKMECVIIDGGSQDGTLELIEKYRKRFLCADIKMQVISEKDQGIYDAMNKGVGYADGDRIHFLNAGDRFHGKNALKELIGQIGRNDEIIIGKIIFFDGYLGKTIVHSPIEELKKGMIFCHQAILSPKQYLEAHPFHLKYKYCADYEWLLAMYLKGIRMRCVDVLVADYDADGVSNRHADASRKEMWNIQKEYGISEQENVDRQINWKYAFYKKIGKHKALSKCFYDLYGKKHGYFLMGFGHEREIEEK